MQDLGTLPGDLLSGAIGINDADVIVGVSLDAGFNIRPFVLEGGVMTDLNAAVSPSRLHLMFAASINNRGQIAGLAVNSRTGALHGYVATPTGPAK
jgi:hypothetical protein